jgi:hypothetical protein
MKVSIGNSSFVRDTKNHALLQTSHKETDDYRVKRKMIDSVKAKDQEINTLRTEISELRNDMEEIKNLLRGLNK